MVISAGFCRAILGLRELEKRFAEQLQAIVPNQRGSKLILFLSDQIQYQDWCRNPAPEFVVLRLQGLTLLRCFHEVRDQYP